MGIHDSGGKRDETVPLSSLQALGHQQPRVSLLLYHSCGVEAVSLARGQAVVVGRSAPSDVAVPDLSLSRQHARFEWQDDALWVEDLGSTNGTTVNGEKVERAEIAASDEVALGRVTVSIHELAAPGRGVESRDRFAAHLEEEVARARFFERRLSLMLVRHGHAGDAPPPLRRWCQAVQQRLRPVDRVGLFGGGTLAVLMPEADQDHATRVAQTVLKEAGRADLTLRFAIASFPETGGSAAKLTEICRVALQRAGADEPVVAAGAAQDPRQWVEQAAGEGEAPQVAGAVIRSEAMKKLFEMVERLSRSTIPVLIIGETGTGKEIVARAIHEGGDRREGPIRCVNCAAIPDQLIESALFGHERGAFTGATQRSTGIFEEADGGTVMLDEVGELSPSAQAALLRVLETKQICRVGSSKEIAVDVRVVAATHRDLEAMCDAGTFRWDLLYRLNTMVLRVPPLHRRPEEIEPLARHFLEQATADGRSPVREISGEALTVLRTYHWPGNVRELRNEIERAVVVAAGEVITAEDLSERVGGETVSPAEGEEEGRTFKDLVQAYETRLLLDALRRNGWNQAAVVRELKIPMRTLTNKVKAYNLYKPGD